MDSSWLVQFRCLDADGHTLKWCDSFSEALDFAATNPAAVWVEKWRHVSDPPAADATTSTTAPDAVPGMNQKDPS